MKRKLAFKVPAAPAKMCRILKGEGHEAYLVGGCVRDMLLGLKAGDHDITTDCLPEKTMGIFRKKGYKVVPTGIRFGTVTVLAGGKPYEITTYRKESKYTDGRRPDKVTFSATLEEDLARRDFTCNAMAYNPSAKKLMDIFGGAEDMKKRIIRAVGDPAQRFAEDHLRMMRAVRYAARLGYGIDKGTFSAVKKYGASINKIAAERVMSELLKMAGEPGPRFARALELMKQSGLMKALLPEVDRMGRYKHDKKTHPEGNVWEHTLQAVRRNRHGGADVNLAILFHDIGKPATYSKAGGKIVYWRHNAAGARIIEAIAKRLKMSGETKDKLMHVAHEHMKFARILEMGNHKFMRLVTDKNWPVLYAASKADSMARGGLHDGKMWKAIDRRVLGIRREYEKGKKLEKIRGAVNGHLIMKIKAIPPGPDVGRMLNRTVEWIIDSSVDIGNMPVIRKYISGLK